MGYRSLQHFISTLESSGELLRITEFVSPRLEITEIADRMVKNKGKALLFENTGTDFPVLINAFASEKRMCLALGVNNLDEIRESMNEMIQNLTGPKDRFWEKLRTIPLLKEIASFMPKRKGGRGTCQEVVVPKPDLTRLPVLTCWPADGGPFITLPVVHTREPESGTRNVGMYRMQIFDAQTTGMHWHLHKGSARHFNKYKERGEIMPVTVTLGGDPVYTYVATAPLQENMDEYLLVGFLRKKKVGLVKCLTNDLEIPSDVDFVIEGYIDPQEDPVIEGPFGDHTGFYSLPGLFPKFHVTCITHRKDAVYPATVVGIPPMEDEWFGKATERIFLFPVKAGVVPELVDMNMPVEGVFHNIVLTSIRKSYPGQGIKVMSALWGAGQMMFNKIMVVVNDQVPVQDVTKVAKEISLQVDPLKDIHFIRGPLDILDHSSSEYAYGSKMGIDATGSHDSGMHSEIQRQDEFFIDRSALQRDFREIVSINQQLIEKGISVLIIAFRKSRVDNIREAFSVILNRGLIKGSKFIIVMDEEVEITQFPAVTWICANNIEPLRDCFFVKNEENIPYPSLIIDGTRKSEELDKFSRPWPNIIVMDEEIIKKVDANWEKYKVGTFLPSPSLQYKKLVFNKGAVMTRESKSV